MNKTFTYKLLFSKPETWTVSEQGVTYKGIFYPYSEIKHAMFKGNLLYLYPVESGGIPLYINVDTPDQSSMPDVVKYILEKAKEAGGSDKPYAPLRKNNAKKSKTSLDNKAFIIIVIVVIAFIIAAAMDNMNPNRYDGVHDPDGFLGYTDEFWDWWADQD